MRRSCVVLSLIAIVSMVGLVPAPAAERVADPVPNPGPNPAPKIVKLGILTGMFRDVSPSLIQAAASPFKDIFKKETGLDSQVVLVDDHEQLAVQMKNKSLDFGVFHGFEYAWVREKYPEILPLAITHPKSSNTIQACLVVNVDSKATSPKDLKGTCVTLPTGTKAHCQLFLDRLREKLPPETCCPIPMRKLNPEGALEAVANGNADAALVDDFSLTAYLNNNPGAGAQLKVLAKSEPFPVGVIAYRKDTVDAKMQAQVRQGLVNVNQNASGRTFLMLWKLEGFGDPTPKFEEDLKRSLEKYPPPKVK